MPFHGTLNPLYCYGFYALFAFIARFSYHILSDIFQFSIHCTCHLHNVINQLVVYNLIRCEMVLYRHVFDKYIVCWPIFIMVVRMRSHYEANCAATVIENELRRLFHEYRLMKMNWVWEISVYDNILDICDTYGSQQNKYNSTPCFCFVFSWSVKMKLFNFMIRRRKSLCCCYAFTFRNLNEWHFSHAKWDFKFVFDQIIVRS